jgi:hypothetical protein
MSSPGRPRKGPLCHMLMTRTQDLVIIIRSARLNEISSRFEGVFMLDVRAYTNRTSKFPSEKYRMYQ